MMSKWLSDEEIDWCEAPVKGPNGLSSNSYFRLLCDQAREANRLRAGLEVIQKDVEAVGLGLLYSRICDLMEEEK